MVFIIAYKGKRTHELPGGVRLVETYEYREHMRLKLQLKTQRRQAEMAWLVITQEMTLGERSTMVYDQRTLLTHSSVTPIACCHL